MAFQEPFKYGASKYGISPLRWPEVGDAYGGQKAPISVSMGYVTESESLTGITQPKIVQVAVTTESETLYGITIGSAAFPWTYGQSKFGGTHKYGGQFVASSGPLVISMGTVSENEYTFVVSASKPIIKPITVTTETETTFAVLGQTVITTVLETETAQSVNIIKTVSFTLTTETELARPVDGRTTQAIQLGYAVESETPQAVTAIQIIYVTVPVTTESETPYGATPISGETVVQIEVVRESEVIFRIPQAAEGVTYNKFIIDPINNGTLSSVTFTNPAEVLIDQKYERLVTFNGWFFGKTPSDAQGVREKILEITLDRQIVEVFYPPDNSLSGYYYLRDAQLDVVSLASGLYQYSIDCEKTLVSSG